MGLASESLSLSLYLYENPVKDWSKCFWFTALYFTLEFPQIII